jgi:hypothetical protein
MRTGYGLAGTFVHTRFRRLNRNLPPTYKEGGISMHIRNQILALAIALAMAGTAGAQAVAPTPAAP